MTFAIKIDLTNLKSDVDEIDIDILKTSHTNETNVKSKVDKLDNDELKIVPIDLKRSELKLRCLKIIV